MLLTPFGEVEWNDPQSMWSFLCAHDLKHTSLAQVLANNNVPAPAFLLTAQIDDDWVQQHFQQHVLLAQVIPQSANSSIYDLLTSPMEDEETFYDWHDIHDLIHQQIDESLGISGS